MSMSEPDWFKYVVWDYSDPSYPVMKGLKKDTPKEIIKQFKEDQKALRELEEEHIFV